MDNLKVIIHGHDVSDKVSSFELRRHGVVNYISGAVGSFNRSDILILDKHGRNVAASIKRVK